MGPASQPIRPIGTNTDSREFFSVNLNPAVVAV